ncbi:MAG: class I SAM-dependent methyltransferase [Pseudomonadota bacterium]
MNTQDILAVSQEEIFDKFADDYDLLLKDWKQYAKEQGTLLDRIFKIYAGDHSIKSVLDCTCGIGTQCIGLARFDYRVTGTDISDKSILRARDEAMRCGVDITFKKADIRRLDEVVQETFDAVISCDNSLPTLLSEDDLLLGLKNMYDRLAPSGLCVISIRDYDQILAEKKRFYPRQIHEIDGKRVVVFDLWDYQDKDIIVFHVFYLHENESGWDMNCRHMVYRSTHRNDLISALKQTGFSHIEVIKSLDEVPLQFDFYICKRE